MLRSLPGFVDTVPDFAVIDGQMHVNMGGLRLVMSTKIFEVGCVRGLAAIADWKAQNCEAEIIPITRGQRADH